MVANALSRKKRPKMITSSDKLIQGFEKMEIEVKLTGNGIERLVEIAMQPELLQEIKLCQERITSEGRKSMLEKALKSEKDNRGIIRYFYQVGIPNDREIKDANFQKD